LSFESDIRLLKNDIEDCVEGQCFRWWHVAAQECVEKERCHFITLRGVDKLYLARFWLTPPTLQDNGDLSSDNSTLLHYFATGDDAGLMHDHPYDFRTLILNGGYTEQVPGDRWLQTRCHHWNTYKMDGPRCLATYRTLYLAGQEIEHQCRDLHAALHPLPDTWTLVTTGPRLRKWGFHPPGQPWISHNDYFAQKAGA